MLKLLWPLLIVKLKVLRLIWQGAAYFVQNKSTIILHGNLRRPTIGEFPYRTPRSLETQNVSICHFLPTIRYGLGIINPFSWTFNAISSTKKEKEEEEKNRKVTLFQCPSCYVTLASGQQSSSLQLNPDWSEFKFQARQPYAREGSLERGCLSTSDLILSMCMVQYTKIQDIDLSSLYLDRELENLLTSTAYIN